MKKIRLRVWDTLLQKWVQRFVIDEFGNVFGLDEEWNEKEECYFLYLKSIGSHKKRFEKLLSTGLNDDEGKEIFEGDIVLTEDYGEGYPMVVKWDEKTASFYCHDKTNDDSDHLNIRAARKVISNIYEMTP